MTNTAFGPFSLLEHPVTSGAILPLTSKPRGNSLALRMTDGWSIYLEKGLHIALVRGPELLEREAAEQECQRALYRALDILSVRNLHHLNASGPLAPEERLYWFKGEDKLVVRIVGAITSTVTMEGRGTVRGPDGEELPAQPAPPEDWHPSFGYFRRSQVTDDLFDAYRNLYLALEALLSHIEPPKRSNGGWERDKAWFLRSLRRAGSGLELDQYAASRAGGDAAARIYSELYEDVRIAIFHAKLPRKPHIPGDPVGRQLVFERLQQIGRLYTDLAREHLGARLGGTRLAAETSRAMTRATLGAMEIRLTDQATDFDDMIAEARVGHPDAPHVMELESVTYGENGRASAVWRASTHSVGPIRSVVGILPDRGGQIGLTSTLDADLTVEGFDRVEFEVASLVRGSGELKQNYTT